MCGCKEQKYVYVPGVENVKEYPSPVSSAFDLKTSLLDVTVCGISSSLVQVTVVPALTVTFGGLKVKLSIFTRDSIANAGPAINAITAASATRAHLLFVVMTLIPSAACR